jgi:hypothetical protein
MPAASSPAVPSASLWRPMEALKHKAEGWKQNLKNESQNLKLLSIFTALKIYLNL